MNRIRRQVGRVVNPVSTAASRWWCESAVRHMLTGYGPPATQRRLFGDGTRNASLPLPARQAEAAEVAGEPPNHAL